jgi:hypothetical protein
MKIALWNYPQGFYYAKNSVWIKDSMGFLLLSGQ